MTLEEQIFEYTLNFCRETGADVDPIALRNGIDRHVATARAVVTDASLERIGHQHLAVMINTAARYSLTLGEVINEGLRTGVQPVSILCSSLKSKRDTVTRTRKRPKLQIVK